MSKFSGLIKAAQEEKPKAPGAAPAKTAKAETEEAAKPETQRVEKAPARRVKAPKAKVSKAGEQKPPADRTATVERSPRPAPKPLSATREGRRRRIGRSADPSYSKSTMYIHQDVHQEVKRLLIGTGKDYSELVEDLLRQWLNVSKS